MNNYRKLLYLTTLGLIVACGTGNDTAGNTTDIENAIAIRIYDGEEPAAMVRYQVLPSWYVADPSDTTNAINYTYEGTTDSAGWAYIDGHQNGSYTINTNDPANVLREAMDKMDEAILQTIDENRDQTV